MKSREEIISFITEKVKHRFESEGSGHDWWHIERVRLQSLKLAKSESADLFIVELAALLHDVADHKLHGGDVAAGLLLIKNWLNETECPSDVVQEVLEIVSKVSYKGAEVADEPMSIEGQIVQDADRLDAIGAIGIARAFAYGGHKGRLLYHPEEKPELHTDFETYKNSTGHTINHFYEKLMLLKDRMHTKTAMDIAEKRHAFMELFLRQFMKDWDGN
jgi:uncharacterized protein